MSVLEPQRPLSELQQDEDWLWGFYLETVEANPFIPKRINPKDPSYPYKAHPKQIEFLCSLQEEVFYGGAGGGGKTDALLMAALQFMHIVPNYHALILRNASPDLKQADGLVPRCHEWFGHMPGVVWNEQQKTFRFPMGGTLRLGQMEIEKDKLKFRGGAWQYIAFDELSLFDQSQYTYLFSRKRKLTGSWIPTRMRSASNPGGKGHGWVKEYFVKPGDPSRPFISARIEDNPSLDEQDYRTSLSKMLEHERRQIEDGSWEEFVGGRFDKNWFRQWTSYVDRDDRTRIVLQHGTWEIDKHSKEHFHPCQKGKLECDLCRGYTTSECWSFMTVDLAASVKTSSDFTVIMTMVVTPRRDLLVVDVQRVRIPVDKIVPLIEKKCDEYSPMWIGIEDTGFQVAIADEARRNPNIPMVRGLKHDGKDKLVRATAAINWASEGKIYIPAPCRAHPWVENFLIEIAAFTGDDTKDAYDDQVDCLAYGCLYLQRFGMGSPPKVTLIESANPHVVGYNSGGSHVLGMR